VNQPTFRAGDFAWCAFPESEHPVRPSRHLHIAYRETATAEALQAIVDLDLTELADIEPPRGYGRD
jgi:hypothetical protein